MTTTEPVVDRGDELAPSATDDAAVAAAIAAKAEKDAADLAEVERLAKGGKKIDDDDEGDEEEEGEEGKVDKKKNARIPLSRHKAMMDTARSERDVLEAKLAQYERGDDFAATNDALTKAEKELLILEERHAQELIDGKAAEANKTTAEIRRLDKAIAAQQIALSSTAAESRAYERARYDVVVERVEEAFPTLNPDIADTYDKAAMNKIIRISKTYQMDGLTPAKSLQAAVKDVMGEPATKKQEVATEVTPNVDAAEVAAAARKEAATKKALETVGKQPADLKKAGQNSDALGGGLGNVDVMKLDQDSFAKLDEAALSRMRGDTLQ